MNTNESSSILEKFSNNCEFEDELFEDLSPEETEKAKEKIAKLLNCIAVRRVNADGL